MHHKAVKIIGTGAYMPGNKLSIHQVDDILGRLTQAPKRIGKWLERMRNLMEEILEVEYYHYAIDPVTKKFTEDNISMSVKVAEMAINNAGIDANEIDFIAYGSAHQDQMPTASVIIQEKLGIDHCAEISIHANCTSAYKAFLTAFDFIRLGRAKTALVISSSMSSSELRADYYHQEIVKKEELFLRYFLSDGAGAVILQSQNDVASSGLFVNNAYIESIGGNKPAAMLNKRPAYWMNPKEEYEKGYHHLAQMFNEQLGAHFYESNGSVFYNGLKRMIDLYEIDLSKLKYFQVNFPSKHISELIIEECEKLGINKNTFYSKMASMGYAGPPMVFICLHKIFTEEKLEKGDTIISFVTEVSKFMQAGFTLEYH
ncbi:3-oxoacyl-ACP synthase III family protein [candidate division KSB1 bacterium]